MTTSQNPIGGVTLAGYAGGMARVTGWALDPDTTDPLRVHAYSNGTFVIAGDANTDRPEIGAKYPSLGSAHGFDLTVKVSAGTNNVCIYAINVGPGTTNPSLGCVRVPGDGSPLGSLDNAVASKGAVTVSGWAIDLKTTDAIQVAITVDGKTNADGDGGQQSTRCRRCLPRIRREPRLFGGRARIGGHSTNLRNCRQFISRWDELPARMPRSQGLILAST